LQQINPQIVYFFTPFILLLIDYQYIFFLKWFVVSENLYYIYIACYKNTPIFASLKKIYTQAHLYGVPTQIKKDT